MSGESTAGVHVAERLVHFDKHRPEKERGGWKKGRTSKIQGKRRRKALKEPSRQRRQKKIEAAKGGRLRRNSRKRGRLYLKTKIRRSLQEGKERLCIQDVTGDEIRKFEGGNPVRPAAAN